MTNTVVGDEANRSQPPMITQATLNRLSQRTAEKLVKTQEQINQLREVLSVSRLDKQNALVRRLVRKTQDGTIGQPDAAVESTPPTTEGEDMEDEAKVSFGDQTTYNITEPPARVSAAKAPGLLPYILAAAIGGGGLGAAAATLPSLLRAPAAAPPAQTVTDTDTNTQYDLKFKE